jgi:hypothetical protein
MRGALMFTGLAMAVLAGCGDDDDGGATATTRASATTTATSTGGTATGTTVSAADATEDDYLAAIVRSLSEGPPGEVRTTPEQAECMAPKWLGTVGVERLKAHDIAPSMIGDDNSDDGSALADLGLTEAEGNALYDAFGDCGVDLRHEFVQSMTAELNASAAACVGEAMTDDLLRRLMVASIVQGDGALDTNEELAADFSSALAPCEALENASPTTT